MFYANKYYSYSYSYSTFGGASHDSFVWNQHPVKEHLINLTNSGENVYLLGDYLMTPIINAAEGSPEEYYTKLHMTARAIVERTIGILKNRWRCLLGHRVLHYHPNVAARIINACCVLHNFCNKEGLFINADTNMSVSSDNASNDVLHPVIDNTASADLRRGIVKKAALVQQLWASRT